MKPVIAISMGDYNGIGPEVILKSLSGRDQSISTPLIIGHDDVFRFYSEQIGLNPELRIISRPDEVENNGKIHLLRLSEPGPGAPVPGELSEHSGRAAMQAVDMGVDLCLDRKAQALVTAPISKESIHLAGYSFPGHTEFLAKKTGSRKVLMLMVSGKLRVGLLTAHMPLSEVSEQISAERLFHTIRLFGKTLTDQFGIRKPGIAILGLNPHAGDGGVLGREEFDKIRPAIDMASGNGLDVSGPLAADGLFGSGNYKQYDGILAMYHDQGMIPFKTLSFGSGVNYTAGLPIIRTSPDHGTAFGIAGKNRASARSFRAAYSLSIQLAINTFQR